MAALRGRFHLMLGKLFMVFLLENVLRLYKSDSQNHAVSTQAAVEINTDEAATRCARP